MGKVKIGVIGLKGLPAFGGAATVGENIIRQLKNEYEFTVYATSSHTERKSGYYNGFRQVVFRKIPFKKLNTLYYYMRSCIHAVFRENFDLIHLHHRDATFIIPFLKIRYKVLVTTHGFTLTDKWIKYKWFFTAQDKLFLDRADHITVVSLKDFRYIQSHNESLLHKVTYIPNGVSKKDIRENNNEGTYILFASGRILRSKGCLTAIEALSKAGYKDKVVVAGKFLDARYEKEVKKASENLNVTFKGLIKSKDELNELIYNSRFFLYPSYIESMSMMLLEAVACGVPVICSSIQENRDIFSDDEVYFATPNDPDDFADKIKSVMQNYHLAKTKAKKAQEKLEKNYTWENIAKEYAVLYNMLSQ